MPKGYQYGDAKLPTLATAYLAGRHTGDKAYDESVRRQVLRHWNVIEGDQH